MKNIYSNIYSFNKKSYKKTIKALKKGNIVSLPTETVYGLAGNAYSQKSINKIFNFVFTPDKRFFVFQKYSWLILKIKLIQFLLEIVLV